MIDTFASKAEQLEKISRARAEILRLLQTAMSAAEGAQSLAGEPQTLTAFTWGGKKRPPQRAGGWAGLSRPCPG